MASLSYLLRNFPTISSSKESHSEIYNPTLKICKTDSTLRLPHSTISQLNITQNGKVKYGDAERGEHGSVTKMDINQGVFFDGLKFRQTYIIRSTEVGPQKTATFESILNLLQETGLNHIARLGNVCGDEYGATREMVRSNLVWVVTRMQVEVDRYPQWGEKIDVDTWYAPSTKNSVQRESLIHCGSTGKILARATSIWVLMNRATRRLSKMSETVRTEISPSIIDKPMIKQMNEKIEKLDIGSAKYFISNLKVIPDRILKTHQLSTLVLEYRKECGSSDLVQSLCKPYEYDDEDIWDEGDSEKVSYTHLLQIERKAKNEEILRGRTTWKATSSIPIV